MERKLGEIFEYEGKRLKVEEVTVFNGCINCYFEGECSLAGSFFEQESIVGSCFPDIREDGKNVIFKEVKGSKNGTN